MASNRHLGRIVALQTLYEYDFRVFCNDLDVDLESVTMRNIGRYHDTLDDKPFVLTLVNGVASAFDSLDLQIAPLAPEWPVEQIARVDKVILRMALWELQNATDVPPKVVINEAVELAKAFGGDSSSRFVNGVLGTAFRQMNGELDSKSDSAVDQSGTVKKPKSKAVSKSANKDSTKPAEQTPKKAAKKAASKSVEKPANKKSSTKDAE